MSEQDFQESAVPRLQPGTDPGGGVPVNDELPAPWRDIVESVRRVLETPASAEPTIRR